MKKIFIAASLITFCSPLVASKPQAEPNPLKLTAAVCMIWTDERLVSCVFVRGKHQNISIVETLPETPSPFPGEINATYKKDDIELSISLNKRLAAKYSLTMKTLYSQLNKSHQLFNRLTAHVYTDGSVSVKEFVTTKKK